MSDWLVTFSQVDEEQFVAHSQARACSSVGIGLEMKRNANHYITRVTENGCGSEEQSQGVCVDNHLDTS